MKDLKITKGEWYIKHRFNVLSENDEYVCSCGGQRGNMSPEKQTEMNEANTELIANAGTTANKCNLLPSELLEQRDELLEALKDIVSWIKEGDYDNNFLIKSENAIKKAQQ